MIHTIKNDKIQLSVKQIGAEICSIKSMLTGKEYIWDANPDFWANSSPILFPIVGALKDGKYKFKGKEYALPQHGFMRFNKEVELIDEDADSLSFQLDDNEETLKVFPFEFSLNISYSLDGNKVCMKHQVINPGNKDLFFSVGTHPAFKCPINDGEKYEDYYLEFEKEEFAQSFGIENALIGKITKEVFDKDSNGQKCLINLHSQLFNDGALVFKDLKSTTIRLKSRKSKQSVSVHYKGWPFMGIWAKPNAPFVCIEPWLGIADGVDSDQNFETKEGIIKLAPEDWFEAEYFIEIEE